MRAKFHLPPVFRRLRATLHSVSPGIVLLGGLSACHLDPSKDLRPVDVKVNPTAHDGDTLEFRFSGLPGAIRLSDTHIDYEVSNRDCVPIDYGMAFGGVRLTPRYQLPVRVWLQPDGALMVLVPENGLIDEDYYGLGKCHWALQGMTLTFVSKSGTTFVAGISAEDIAAGHAQTLHYLKSDYVIEPEPQRPIYGEKPGFYLEGKPLFLLDISVGSRSVATPRPASSSPSSDRHVPEEPTNPSRQP